MNLRRYPEDGSLEHKATTSVSENYQGMKITYTRSDETSMFIYRVQL
jgi:hypothetical protein